MTAPVRAALYLRVSTGRQAENDLSIPDQRRQAKGYCTSRGWEIVADYVEPGVSATDDRRPEFQRMIDAATTKPPAFDLIVVHSFSRFFRDQFQLEFYVRRLAKNGVRLVSITQELGDDPMSNMIRQIMALFDEYQSKENAKHTLRAMKENARQGFWNGSLPPIGYRIVEAAEQHGHRTKKTLGDRSHPGRDRAADLPPGARGRRRLRADGRQVDHQASKRGWHPHPRRRALGHRRRAQGADTHDLHRPPPLQHQVLEDARAKARHRSRRDGGAADNRSGRVRSRAGAAQDAQPGADRAAYHQRPDPPHGHLLLRRLRNGDDAADREGRPLPVYTCSTKARQGETGCKGRTVPMDKLDHVVADHIEQRLLQPKRLEEILSRPCSTAGRSAPSAEQRISPNCASERAEADAKLKRLYDAIENGVADLSDPMLKDRVDRAEGHPRSGPR